MISWNVNGLRACARKGFIDFFKQADADIFCVQETKMEKEQMPLDLSGYLQFWNSAEKKGYSGTAVFTKKKPLNVFYDIAIEEHSHEGRVITLEYETFFLINIYTPNAKDKLQRLDYRTQWEDAFRNFVLNLDAKKPVIICGDLNVAHNEIDLKNPSNNHNSAGFTDTERAKFTHLLDSGFIDSFRELYPQKKGAYTWWSYRNRARERGAGWRIDYFLVSSRLKSQINAAVIHQEQLGSDHCPVELVCIGIA